MLYCVVMLNHEQWIVESSCEHEAVQEAKERAKNKVRDNTHAGTSMGESIPGNQSSWSVKSTVPTCM